MDRNVVRRGIALAVLAAALAAAEASPQEATPAADLVARLGDANPAVRDDAADRLTALGADALPALTAAYADDRLRDGALDVTGRLGSQAKGAVAPVTAILRDAASPSRAAAARALGAIGAEAASALNPLSATVGDPKSGAQAESAQAIGKILVSIADRASTKGATLPWRRAVGQALDWFARHQEADGRWSAAEFGKRCKPVEGACFGAGDPSYDVGVTGLACVALTLAGETPFSGEHRETLRRGLEFLRNVQGADGLFGDRKSQHTIYNHVCAMLGLGEACRASGLRSLRGNVERATQFLLGAQAPSGGWRYDLVNNKDADTSVTAWAVEALAVAADCGVAVDPSVFNGAVGWVDAMTDPKTGRTGYQQKGGPPARTSEMQESFPASFSESLTACALAIRLAAGRTTAEDSAIRQGLDLLRRRLPQWNREQGSIDLYYWMHGSRAARDASGDDYAAWRSSLLPALVPSQCTGSTCDRGSWPPIDPWAPEGGRAYTTSMAVIALCYCAADPSLRPGLTPSQKQAAWALEKALKADDAAVRKAAARALEEIRRAFK